MQRWTATQRATTPTVRALNQGRILGLSLLLMSGAVGGLSVIWGQEKLATHEIRIDNFSFTPMDLTIPTGTQVAWVNKDDVPHNVISVDHQFKSQALDTDERFSFTFQHPGTYEYFCSVHPKMTGKIVVK
jgi:plastocyanin